MSENKEQHYSITISEKQLSIIKSALLVYNNNVITNPKKNMDVTSREVLELAHLINDKQKWRVP